MFPAEVFNIIFAVISYKSPGLDGMPSYFVRIAAEVIAVPLSMLCSLSFLKGVLPVCIKRATDQNGK